MIDKYDVIIQILLKIALFNVTVLTSIGGPRERCYILASSIQ